MNWVIRFKKDDLGEVMCNYAIKVHGADQFFLAVFCTDPGLSSTSPHGKSKLHLNNI